MLAKGSCLPVATELYNIPGVRECFLELWNRAPVAEEAAAWLIHTTAPEGYRLVGFKTGGTAHVSIGHGLHGALAQLHTHPFKLSPKPSTTGGTDQSGHDAKGDWGAAVRLNLPVYVLSVSEIWKIMPIAKEPVIVQVAKNWI